MATTVWTVEEMALGRDGMTATDSWSEDYSTKEEALATARADWEHLRKSEKQHRAIIVFKDEIYDPEDESNEQRRSWEEGGCDPILTITNDGEVEG